MRLFDILGPVMVGPSSSHTAGAVRIGLTARKLLGDRPVHADISLHGSSAATAKLPGMRRSSGCIPSRPAISAQSVPWP